jgi:SPP1 family predicted phage head-tail adaptor
MRAGDLRHWLEIQVNTLTVSESGDRTDSWTTFANCWGSVATSGGREFYAARQVIADLSHNITIRYVPGVRPDMRVKFTDPKNADTPRYFNIRAMVNPDERNETLMMQCTEVLF